MTPNAIQTRYGGRSARFEHGQSGAQPVAPPSKPLSDGELLNKILSYMKAGWTDSQLAGPFPDVTPDDLARVRARAPARL